MEFIYKIYCPEFNLTRWSSKRKLKLEKALMKASIITRIAYHKGFKISELNPKNNNDVDELLGLYSFANKHLKVDKIKMDSRLADYLNSTEEARSLIFDLNEENEEIELLRQEDNWLT